MKFDISKNSKYFIIIIVLLCLLTLTVCRENLVSSKKERCSFFNQNKIKEEIRDDYTRKIIFLVFLTYFYTNFL